VIDIYLVTVALCGYQASFLRLSEEQVEGGWFENSSGEVNICPSADWSLVMKRSEIVIRIEM